VNKINNKTLLSAGAGIILGVIFLVLNLLYSSFENTSASSINVEEKVLIITDSNDKKGDLLIPLLVMFGFNVDALNDKNNDDLSLASENISVRIVAQSSVGKVLHTLLEIVTSKETKRIVVTEGTVVNGFLINSINSKQLILEKDSKEYIINFFHPIELNQDRLENDLK
jgi:hypothetical protein